MIALTAQNWPWEVTVVYCSFTGQIVPGSGQSSSNAGLTKAHTVPGYSLACFLSFDLTTTLKVHILAVPFSRRGC